MSIESLIAEKEAILVKIRNVETTIAEAGAELADLRLDLGQVECKIVVASVAPPVEVRTAMGYLQTATRLGLLAVDGDSWRWVGP